MLYENLQMEAAYLGVEVYEQPMRPALKGLYADGVIWINRDLSTFTEKACVLAEELGHYHTTAGDVLDQNDITNRKQERRARAWAYQRLVPLESLVRAYHAGVSGRHELAEFLGVDEKFLENALGWYQDRYGSSTIYKGYAIYFDPPRVELMEWGE